MNFIEITDPGDWRISDYLDIRERDLVGRRGLFIAEGEVVIRALLKSRWPVKSLLIAKERASKISRVGDTVADTPIYLAEQAVMDRIVGFSIHRGLLAVGERDTGVSAASLLAGLPDRALVAAAVGIANHDNIGGIFRNAAAFGLDAVLLDETSCDPLYRKALRVSVGGVLETPFARVTAAELPDLLADAGFETVALTPTGEERLDSLRLNGRVALLLGAEGPGLAPALMARARRVRIEMRPGFDSLNVATAAAIAFHHLRAQGA
ncbi:MAG TPA: RNA methyltransferase [Phenylobacterium sp.]|nr:RNA methyltransferase [Phenylobacterium sp.]